MKEKTESLNVSITGLPGVSPLNLARIGERDEVTYAKRKWKQIQEAAVERVVECLDLPPESITGSSKELSPTKEAHAGNDIEYLVNALKEKLKTSNRQQQISLLTLASNG